MRSNFGLSQLRGTAEFTAGMACGIASGADEMSRLIFQPFDTIHNAGTACDTAIHYYQEKFSTGRTNEIALDAQSATDALASEALSLLRKPPHELGLAVGEGIYDVALTEILPPITIVRDSPLAGSAQQFDDFCATLSPRRRAKFGDLDSLRPSPDFASQLDELINQLPAEIQQLREAKGIRIIAIKTLHPLYPEPASGLFIAARKRAQIFISEQSHTLESGMVLFNQLQLTLHHELSHAIDCFTGPGGPYGWFSDLPHVRVAFNKDLESLNETQRSAVMTLLGGGSKQKARRETIAELVSHESVIRTSTSSTAHDTLVRSFPRLHKIVKDGKSPFIPLLK